MLKAIAKFFERVAMWLLSPNYRMRLVDGWPRIVRHVRSVDHRPPFFHPAAVGGKRLLMYIGTMPKHPSWRIHQVRVAKGTNTPYVEMIGMVDGEWCSINECTDNVEVSKEILANSFYPALARLPDDAWNKLDIESIEMIMKDVIIDRWKQHPEQQLGIIVQTFHYKMPFNEAGVDGLYAGIDGTVFLDSDEKPCFASYVTEEFFNSRPVKEEYVIEAVVGDQKLVYTISDCPEDWHVHRIEHDCGLIIYLRSVGDRHFAFRRLARPGSYVQAMAPEQRKAVLSEWEIPEKEVTELQRMALMSAADLISPEPVELEGGLEDSGVMVADVGTEETVAGTHIDVSRLWAEGAAAWDSLPKLPDPIFYRTEHREWAFVVKVDDFPIGAEVAYVTPAQYSKDGPIEAIVAFKEVSGHESIIAPRLYPVVEMKPIDNVVKFGDDYITSEIVVNSRGWRYTYTDTFCPDTCKVVSPRLVRNNPTGKPLITFEYERATGPMAGRIAQRRFVVPTHVARAGSNNQRKGKRQRGTGKRR